MIILEIVLIWLFQAPATTLLGTLIGIEIATDILILLVIGIVGTTIGFVATVNRRGRFAALTPKGAVIRNLENLVVIPFDEIVFIAIDDNVPWIQRRGGKRVSLRGIFDNKAESRLFKKALWAVRGELATDGRLLPSENNAGPDVPGQPSPPGTCKQCWRADSPKQKSVWLTRIGISNLVGATSGMIVFGFFGKQPSADKLVSVAVALFRIGAVIALVGQWRADKRATRSRLPD